MTTRRLRRCGFRTLVRHDAAAPSRRESQDKAAGDTNELKEKGIHIALFYARRVKSVCRLKIFSRPPL